MSFKTNGVTLLRNLQRLAQENPKKAAFVFWDKNLRRTVLTRQEVWDKSRKCAAFLRRQGIVKGDIVCNALVNSRERLITTYGAFLAGAVSMHGQKFRADGEDIKKNWKDSGCKAILVNSNEEKGARSILQELQHIDNRTGKIDYEGLPSLNHVIPISLGDNSLLHILDDEPEMFVDDTVTEDGMAMIMTTSGSTGFAKLVPHTYRRLAIYGGYLRSLLSLTQDSVFYNDGSLGWIGAAPVAYPMIGLTRVLVDLIPGKYEDAGAFIRHVLEEEKCDSTMLLPGDIQSIMDNLNSSKKHTLDKQVRVIGTGGGAISRASMKAIGRITDTITVLYGASEFGLAYGHDVTKRDALIYENACCGYPAPYTETKIVDENLMEVATGESGEILFRGPTLTTGYVNNPEVNDEVFLPDGWWRTSDIGHVNEKGQLFVYCRKSFVINHKGYKHSPGWIEAKIDQHPDIQKSMAVGIPDPIYFEQICLCVIRAPESDLTAEDILEHCKTLFLTTEAEHVTPIPKYFLLFDTFPRNSNGKFDRMAVREMALKRLGVEQNNIELEKQRISL